jgi:hypothetical protein
MRKDAAKHGSGGVRSCCLQAFVLSLGGRGQAMS